MRVYVLCEMGEYWDDGYFVDVYKDFSDAENAAIGIFGESGATTVEKWDEEYRRWIITFMHESSGLQFPVKIVFIYSRLV